MARLRERVDPAELLARLGFTPLLDDGRRASAAPDSAAPPVSHPAAGTPEDATAESEKDGGRRGT